jgi:hypothetical protein
LLTSSRQKIHCESAAGRGAPCYFRRGLDRRGERRHLPILRNSGRFAGAEGIRGMRQVTSLLRSAPSMIGRRLALIVAIAAASLPAAGA